MDKVCTVQFCFQRKLKNVKFTKKGIVGLKVVENMTLSHCMNNSKILVVGNTPRVNGIYTLVFRKKKDRGYVVVLKDRVPPRTLRGFTIKVANTNDEYEPEEDYYDDKYCGFIMTRKGIPETVSNDPIKLERAKSINIIKKYIELHVPECYVPDNSIPDNSDSIPKRASCPSMSVSDSEGPSLDNLDDNLDDNILDNFSFEVLFA